VIDVAGLPDVFVGPAPPAEPPTNGPSAAEAETIAAPARASTMRVEAVACARFMTGTGFAIGPSHFVTNAHVVAGATRVQLSFDGRIDRHNAEVVYFNPDLDVALVYAPNLGLTPLTLADSPPSRGDDAAALGFTGGGRMRVVPASVSRSMDALGRDIYGRSTVSRAVVELYADVAPGDSGGPVMLADGTVGGVTFSESRDQRAIGYAISPVAVAAAIRGSRDRTQPVSPGECLP
jgi:S1-C subfamily serine protease